jgi:epoxyqueuosine reductase QueG
MEISRQSLTAAKVKEKARALGADLAGIADGAALDLSHITDLDGGRVIVMAKRLNAGVARIAAWNDRHKYYNDELTLTLLEEASLEMVYWLEDQGYPALAIPPTHVDPWRYQGDPRAHQAPLIPLERAAVEAGLGTLGLNLQLLTPEFGPRVQLAAVLASIPVECDAPMAQALCRGPQCGRCLKACPADAVGHWRRDWPACDEFRFPYGFKRLTGHIEQIAAAGDAAAKKALLRSETSFYLWQSILRGAGAITGCRRCADVCPVGADYETLLAGALEAIAEETPAKLARLAQMAADELQGASGEYAANKRWVGER